MEKILLNEQEYYDQFVQSSKAFLNQELINKIKNANLLIVGAGSIGNPTAIEAVRAGFTNLTIMDLDTVEVGNLSRQHYSVHQCGKNKAEATVENLRLINPYIRAQYVSEGMTFENSNYYIDTADIIIDAIDIKSLDIIFELHKCAVMLRKPVLVGYDLAGTAMVVVYRYDKGKQKPLEGKITDKSIIEFNQVNRAYKDGIISSDKFVNYIYGAFNGPINPLTVPVEQLKELINRKDDDKTYQIGTTASVIASLMVEACRRILNGEEVKKIITVDIPGKVRKSNPSIFTRLILLSKVLPVMNIRKKEIKLILNRIDGINV